MEAKEAAKHLRELAEFWIGQPRKDACMLGAEALEEVGRLREELVKWQRIRKPTHGSCCTCQRCGQHYDQCRCGLDEVCDELEQAKKRIAELEAEVELLRSVEQQEAAQHFKARTRIAELESRLATEQPDRYIQKGVISQRRPHGEV